MPQTVVAVLLVCGALLSLSTSTARACSGFGCQPDQFIPRTGSVPANLPAVAWFEGVISYDDDDGGAPGKTDVSDLLFECKNSGATRTVAFDLWRPFGHAELTPHAPFAAGESCTVRPRTGGCDLSDSLAWNGPISTEHLRNRADFVVTEAQPLPASLGTIATEPQKFERIDIGGGSGCSERVEVCVVRAEVVFSAEAAPWKDAFIFETTVDGKPWRVNRTFPAPDERGASYLGRGRDLFFSPKPSATQPENHRGLSADRHKVEFRARIPGTEVTLATPAVEIDLNCSVLMPGSGPERDAGVTEASDASVIDDAGDRLDDRSTTPKKRTYSSCSFEPSSGTAAESTVPAQLAIFCLALVWWRRRRRER